MEAGEAGSVRATAAGPSGALWWVSDTARGAPSSFPQRVSRAWMEMKPAAEQRAGTVPNCASGSFPRPGNRACVSTRDATPHRRHHPWTGDPEDPAPSATLCRPISHHPRVCLPSHRRGGLSLRPAASGRACGWGGVPWCVLSERRWPALMASRASAGAVADPALGAHGASHACRLQVDTEENMQNSYPLCGVSTRWWSCVRSSCRVRRKIRLPVGSGSSPIWGRKRQHGTSGVPFERGRRPYACHLAEQPQP